jgi:glutamate/aspartate transport system permease protein
MQEFTFQVFEAFTGATLLYIAINIIVVILMRVLERRLAVPGYVSLGKPVAAH